MNMEDELEIELYNHYTFFAIAIRHYRQIEKLVKQRDQFKIKTERDVNYSATLNASIQRDAMVTTIFCALTLEAFINLYGISNFSKRYFDKHLDKLNPISKWLIIPKLLTGKQISTDGQGYELLKETFKLRDKLVHYKSRKKKVSELIEQQDWVTEKHAQRFIKGVTKILQELKSIDPQIDIDWLEKVEHDPYA